MKRSRASARGVPHGQRLAAASVRRGAALFAVVAFVLALGAASASWTVQQTVLEPPWLEGSLRRSGLVDALYDGVLPAQLDDLSQDGIAVVGESGPRLHPSRRSLTGLRDLIESLCPRGWLTARAPWAAKQLLVPYLAGHADQGELDLQLSGRWRRLPTATARWTARARIGHQILDDVAAPIFAQAAEELITPPLGLQLDDARARELAGRVLPPAWIDAQLVSATRTMVPLLEGETDRCEIRLPLASGVELAAEAVEEEMVDPLAVRRVVLDRFADRWIADAVAVPERESQALGLTEPEIRRALAASIPPRWLRRKTRSVMDALEGYLIGQERSLRFSVDLVERKPLVSRQLELAALDKLDAWLVDTERCSLLELPRAAATLAAGRTPPCLPASEGFVRSAIEPTIGQRAKASVEGVPDRIVFDEARIRELLGAEAAERLARLRDAVADGWLLASFDVTPASTTRGAEQEPWSVVLRILHHDRITLRDIRQLRPREDPRSLTSMLATAMPLPRTTVLSLAVAAASLIVLFRLLTGTAKRRLQVTLVVAVGTPWLLMALAWLGPSPVRIAVESWSTEARESLPQIAAVISGPIVQRGIDAMWSDWVKALSRSLALLSALSGAIGALLLRRARSW